MANTAQTLAPILAAGVSILLAVGVGCADLPAPAYGERRETPTQTAQDPETGVSFALRGRLLTVDVRAAREATLEALRSQHLQYVCADQIGQTNNLGTHRAKNPFPRDRLRTTLALSRDVAEDVGICYVFGYRDGTVAVALFKPARDVIPRAP